MKILPRQTRIPVGISQCAMGDPVRYNGGHKHSKVCTELLARCFEYVPLCPEVAIGLGVPRKPIHLLVDKASADVDAVRVVGVDDPSVDVTDQLRDYADSEVPQLEKIRGYIFMQNSPSCGLRGVRRYLDNGHGIDSEGVGVFARRIQQHFPHLPMEEVGRLNNNELRENFLTRVFAYDAWFRYVEGEGEGEGKEVAEAESEPVAEKRPSRIARIIEFYTAYKYLLMAHNQDATRALGRLLADSKAMPEDELAFAVRGRIMQILSRPASRKDRTNALMHSQGHLKEYLNKEEKAELQQLIEEYRVGHKPLSAVLTMLRHYLPRSPHAFIHSQVLLAAEPAELGLCDFH
ncbi:YbgA family protein [Microbulbifer sp. SA54]|uniref:YbgA family protein n=1 Tax=Microbulbifer sp. SA54 TaxID=3401577 RepID=UPI003AAF4615